MVSTLIPLDDVTREEEAEVRRLKVLTMRLRNMSSTQIAQSLNVDPSTVRRDYDYIRKNWHERFGLMPDFNPAELVGETFAMYRDREQAMLLVDAKLATHTGDLVKIARARALVTNVALAAREKQVSLLQDLGILDRALGTIEVQLPRAEDLRRLLRDAVVSEESLVPEIEGGR